MISAVYSDPHIGHANIIDFCERPFSSVRHMESELIRRYNERIGEQDTVLWLGDCFFLPDDEAREVLGLFNGRKILVRGNHDRRPARMSDIGFCIVTDELVFSAFGHTFRACHYPYKDINNRDQRYANLRPRRRPGEILLHGHTHQAERYNLNAFHCGVDAWDYKPVMLTEIAEDADDGLVCAA